MIRNINKFVLNISATLKHVGPGKPLEKFEINAYPHDKSQCVYTTKY